MSVTPPAGRLCDRVAVITGATSGIGEAIARRFAAEGAAVVVHGQRVEEAAAVAVSIRDEGGAAFSVDGDLADPATPERIARSVRASGGADILVNNAATSERDDLECLDPARFDRIISVNVRAPALMVREFRPQFRDAGGGAVLNIGSVNAYAGQPDLLSYSMSKGALMTMTRNLAVALAAERITVNQLNLGWVHTPNEHALQVSLGQPENWADLVGSGAAPRGSLLTSEEIAHFALAYVERDGSAVSGTVVDVAQLPVGRR